MIFKKILRKYCLLAQLEDKTTKRSDKKKPNFPKFENILHKLEEKNAHTTNAIIHIASKRGFYKWQERLEKLNRPRHPQRPSDSNSKSGTNSSPKVKALKNTPTTTPAKTFSKSVVQVKKAELVRIKNLVLLQG